MNKRQHLTSLLEFLASHGGRESHFDSIYQKLLAEYNSEQLVDNNLSRNFYLNNLRQTIEKQAEDYKSTKQRRPVKGAPSEFRSFVNNFKQDVSEAISMLPKAE